MASGLDDQSARFGVEFNVFRKIRFIEQSLGDADSPRIADPHDARFRCHCDYSVTTLVTSGKIAHRPRLCTPCSRLRQIRAPSSIHTMQVLHLTVATSVHSVLFSSITLAPHVHSAQSQ